MPTKYGRSPWTHQLPKSRVPSYPRHRGHAEVDVAIVGGGLTGCATAYAFAAAGIKVALVEAAQIGRGSSGSSAGWISDDPGVGFLQTEKAIGRRHARHAWHSWRRAALEFAALLRRLNVKCDLQAAPTLQVARTSDGAERLKRDQQARRNAGFDAPLVGAPAILSESGVTAVAAIRTRTGSLVDPYRAAIGLAAASATRGARVFERAPVTRIAFRSAWVDLQIGNATLRAGRVVIATGRPTPLFKPLARHFSFQTTFLALTERVPAGIRRALGRRTAILRDSANPPHVVRWLEGQRLLVGGADCTMVPARQREQMVVQRTGQLMYELSVIYPEISGILPSFGWSVDYARPADGLPYIGPHRNYPRHLFALADASHSITGAYLASRILLRHILDEVEPSDAAFGFTR